uniref:Altered inheritance of mitochondria protein 32 n=1 Tax=Cucumis melo TaxID=3656 RepID=A0A9I9E0Q5_CUCME
MTRSMASVGRRCIGATLLKRLLLTSAMCSCVIEVLRSGRPALKTRTLICCRSFYLLPSKLIKMRSLLGLLSLSAVPSLLYISPPRFGLIDETDDMRSRGGNGVFGWRCIDFSGNGQIQMSNDPVSPSPHQIYRGLKDKDVEMFVEDVLLNGELRESGAYDVLAGSYIFVCAHGSRDKRCGVCGPVLVSKLKEEIELRGLKDQTYVHPCSHIGGHKYGYVTPDDVPELLEKHIGKGEIIERLWSNKHETGLRGNPTTGRKTTMFL